MLSDELIREFIVESHEGLDQVERDLLALEKKPGDAELLDSVFRAVHTIKGTCGFFGFTTLQRVAHAGENLLCALRDGSRALSPDIASALLAVSDALREIVTAIEATGGDNVHGYDSLVERLEELARGPSDAARRVNRSTPHPAAGVTQDSLPMGSVAESTFIEEPALPATLASSGAMISRDLISAAPEESRDFSIGINETNDGRAVEKTRTEMTGSSVAESNIRVDVGQLDKLMTLVGELVLARNQILQYAGNQQDPVLLGATQRLNLITTELQEGVMKTRMQPIGNIWSKFPRVLRDLQALCGKEVRLDMDGQTTELDRTILEAIKDPLTHIIRNAVDHGIESPTVRLAQGKPAHGRLSLRAFHEGGQVIIEIADDGAGLDPAKIRRKAVERGLIAAEAAQRLSDREALRLVFLPGFSTAEKVTNVSGRGVGMDVVRTNIEKTGGNVDLLSERGQGCTVRIKIPLTLAIIPALIVKCGGHRFAVPQSSLLELVRLEADVADRKIEMLYDAPVYRLRGDLLPLVYLQEQLLDGPTPEQTEVNIVVLRTESQTFGLVVDAVHDTEEIVVKPLSKQLKGLSYYAGATIMGDGQVALILDVAGLAQKSGLRKETKDSSGSDDLVAETGAPAERSRTLLLCGLGDRRRVAIPLDEIERLEEFDPGCIESAGDAEVIQYRGRLLHLTSLRGLLGSAAPAVLGEAGRKMNVVVCSAGDQMVGLAVDEIIDTVSAAAELVGESSRPGVLGSIVVQGRVAELIDVGKLLGRADNEQTAALAVV